MPEGIESVVRFERTRLVIFGWPDRTFTHEIALFARAFPAENVFLLCEDGVDFARNAAVATLCKGAPPEIEHFVFVDRDMRPGPAALPFWAPEADVVGCLYEVKNMESWGEPDALHCGLVRFTRKVVDTLPLPWFAFERDAFGRVTKCECAIFRDKVKAAGLSIARAGWCGHKDWR